MGISIETSEDQIHRALKVIVGVLIKILLRRRTNVCVCVCVCVCVYERQIYGVPVVALWDWWHLCNG